jgi:hypothetical protein
MVMEYGENDDAPDGVTKWPFYFSALFILALVLGFAYLHFEEHNGLDQWQLVTCILASALASILVFIPHLLDRFLYLVFDPANRKDEELHRKTYFDIKEMRGDLESLAVKIDKVPSVVDKILSESLTKGEDANSVLEKLRSDLGETKEELLEKIRTLQELTEQSPLLPEPDPAIALANESIGKLGTSFKGLSDQLVKLQDAVTQLPTEFPGPVSPSTPKPETPTVEPDEPTPTEEEENIAPEVEEEENDPIEEVSEESEEELESEAEESETDPVEEENLESEDLEEDTDEEETEPGTDEEENEPAPGSEETEEPADIESRTEEVESKPESDELALDLPDPEETLRKVDALLAGEEASAESEPVHKTPKPKSSTSGTTSVIANVKIGIGNKPYLRGEGVGLSWDEGVPMNFIEIGKWAWTPPRKNAALTVQVYRNDEDPDKGGKIEIKSGQEIEITPEFG